MAPHLYQEGGLLKYEDDFVHAVLEDRGKGHLVICDWLAMPSGQGHSKNALQWLRDEGYGTVEVVDATGDAVGFWQHMQSLGLIADIEMANAAVRFHWARDDFDKNKRRLICATTGRELQVIWKTGNRWAAMTGETFLNQTVAKAAMEAWANKFLATEQEEQRSRREVAAVAC